MKDDTNKQLTVPFGKYKGKPVEMLLKDEQYGKWLAGQDWFQQKYQNMYTLIIHNYHAEPVDTPEHNQMQVKFINETHALKLAFLVSESKLFQCSNNHFKELVSKFLNDLKEHDVDISEVIQRFNLIKGKDLLKITKIELEPKGMDVKYDVTYGFGHEFGVSESTFRRASSVFNEFWRNSSVHLEMRVELKPYIGDDFPAVLRQMKASGAIILVIRKYTGTGISCEEFKQYFLSQGIQVVTEQEVEEINLPSYDKVFNFSESVFT